jgi:hypothetical protein
LATFIPAESFLSRQRKTRPSRSCRCPRHNVKFAVLYRSIMFTLSSFITSAICRRR